MKFLERWPRPETLLESNEEEAVAALMQPIGLNNRRARVIFRFTGTVRSVSKTTVFQFENDCLASPGR